VVSKANISDGKHVMLLCKNESERARAAAHYLNRGLEEDKFCIYASVHAYDNNSITSISSMSPKITDFEQNLATDNLRIINFKPYYESALAGELKPFTFLKQQLEDTLHQRIVDDKSDRILVFADAACCLSENECYYESEVLEQWWQNTHEEWMRTGKNIAVICPHPTDFHNDVAKHNIAHSHDLEIVFDTVNLDKFSVLVVEPDSDLRSLYSEYLSAMGFDVTLARDASECLSMIAQKRFDTVILDTHLRDIAIAKIFGDIRKFMSTNKIILTTTNSLGNISDTIKDFGVEKENVLIKPFLLSNLDRVINKTVN
jgi:CheY-like chemotaxis protein